jgi:purine catabolism regulator
VTVGAHADVGIPLGAMLEHPAWSDVAVLAGAGDRGRLLTGGVVVADLTTRPTDLDGAVLVVVYASDRTDWRLDAVLRRAHEARAGALLIAGTDPVARPTALLSERLALALLGAPDPLGAYAALARTVAEPGLARAETVLCSLAANERSGESVDELLTELQRTLRRPLALLDQRGNSVAGSELLAPAERDLVGRRLAPHATPVAAAMRIELPAGAVVVAHPVTSIGQTSWIAVRVDEARRGEVETMAAAIAVVSASLRERLALRRLQVERSARGRASLLEELRRVSDDLPAPTRRRALDLGWRLDGWHTGIRIGAVAVADIEVVGLRTEVVAALEAEGLEVVVVEQGDGWAAWTTTDRTPGAEQVERQATAIRRAQRALAETVETYVGVGRVHAGPSGIARSLAEAHDAARLAQGRAQTGHFLHVDRLGLAQLLLAWTRTDTFEPAARSLLAPLTPQTGDLLRTLATYLDSESSLTETAAVLGVHRNTVATRMVRIQQILGVDLADPDDRLALHLACRSAVLDVH